jgi:preprotein translocase subunit SecF
MKFLTQTTHIDFMKVRRLALNFSATITVLSLIALFGGWVKWGLDFTGGTLVEVGYAQPVDLDGIRKALTSTGFEGSVQHFGTTREVLVRLAPKEGLETAGLSDKILEALKDTGQGIEVRRVEFIGPQVGEELAEDAGLAMLYALIGILIYVALRFESKLAVAALVATIHDAIVTAGLYTLTPWDFDLTILAAILTVIGYSINDTIVVFDRIRENFRKMRTGTSAEVVNASLNQTLSRTLMTGVTTLMVLAALLIFGGEIIRGFALTVILGILIGTYSSIYVASPVALALGVTKADLMPVKKEGAELDRRP